MWCRRAAPAHVNREADPKGVHRFVRQAGHGQVPEPTHPAARRESGRRPARYWCLQTTTCAGRRECGDDESLASRRKERRTFARNRRRPSKRRWQRRAAERATRWPRVPARRAPGRAGARTRRASPEGSTSRGRAANARRGRSAHGPGAPQYWPAGRRCGSRSPVEVSLSVTGNASQGANNMPSPLGFVYRGWLHVVVRIGTPRGSVWLTANGPEVHGFAPPLSCSTTSCAAARTADRAQARSHAR